MSRSPSFVSRLPTLLRTLRFIRPSQGVAQVRHSLFGLSAPTRLRGVVPDQAIPRFSVPFLPPTQHVGAESKHRVELLGTSFELGDSPDWESAIHGPLFAYHLHQHEYLRCAAFSPTDRVNCMLDWVARHRGGVGWDPHPISLRLLCWGKLLTTPGALELDASARAQILGSMADQTETLSRGLEIRLQANHLLSNLLAVVWSSLLLDGPRTEAWRRRSDMLLDQIDLQIHPDGGHQERSPMYHALLLENLLDLLNLVRAAPERAPAGLAEALASATSRMATALSAMTHPDGEIALFADSGLDIAARPAALIDYARRVSDSDRERAEDPTEDLGTQSSGSIVLPQTGYVRLESEGVLLIASTAGPAPAHQPGHAHCDALAFELSLAGRRVVTDTGLFEYQPGERRDRARSTASHSTLQIDGKEQSEIWSAHRVGGRPVVDLVGWDGQSRAEARCRSWATPFALHRRTYQIDATGVTIVDEIDGPHNQVRFCLPIHPDWHVEIEATEPRARASLAAGEVPGAPGDSRVEFELPEAFTWRVERCAYYPSFGREVERDSLVGVATGITRSTLRISIR